MIYIVHGSDYPANRKLITNQVKKLENIIKLEKQFSDLTPEEVEIHLQSSGMFGETPLLLIDISSNRKTSIDDFIEVLAKAPAQATTIIYANKALGQSNIFIKSANKINAKVIETNKKEEGNTFAFVEAVFSKDRKKAYQEFEKVMTLDDNDPIYFLSLLMYGLRTISYIVFDSPKKKSLQAFTLNKYERIAKNYSQESIKKLYTDFYEVDKGIKTGTISLDMVLPLIMEKVLNSN